MKFYTSHQIALHSAIQDAGFDKPDFSFIKKKGRIIAQHQNSSASFSFIERRESTLDTAKMRVMDKFTYEVRINNEKYQTVPTWEILLTKFNQWLNQVKSNN